MAEVEISQEMELIRYSNEIGFGSLPHRVSGMISRIRRTFANAVTKDINRPYNEQMKDLLKACGEHGVYFVNAEIFGDMDDVGILRIAEDLENPTTHESLTLLVDVFISPMLHNENEADTEENTFLACPYYSDVTIENNTTHEETTIQDINGNTLACMLREETVQLQINTVQVPYEARTFVYDGCHKLYLICDDDDRELAKEYGYLGEDEDQKEIPISELESYYIKSCPLRFIEMLDVERDDYSILPQNTDCPMFIYY